MKSRVGDSAELEENVMNRNLRYESSAGAAAAMTVYGDTVVDASFAVPGGQRRDRVTAYGACPVTSATSASPLSLSSTPMAPL
jgi:hypothetical protein